MKTCIASMAIGEEGYALWMHTGSSITGYAERTKSDLHLIDRRQFPDAHICYEKLQLRELLEEYDRVLYLDADCVVMPNCPNLFELVPYGWFGAFSEGFYFDRSQHLERTKEQFGCTPPEMLKYRYFNAGVMVFDQTHKQVFTPPKVFHNNFGDQTWMNIRVWETSPKFVDIGPHFNRLPSIDWPRRHESFIVHYAGGTAKKELFGEGK